MSAAGSLTPALARFVAGTDPGSDTAAPALAMLRLSLHDWAACGIAGRDEPVARLTRQMVLDEAGRGEAALIGGGRAPARGAALVNGATSHALDYDDTHFGHIGHPSVAILPAALAVAERQGASGKALIEAALIGEELSIRVGQWLGRGHYQIGFHQTATAGAFGATAAAGRLLGLDAPALEMALGLVATRAAGLKAEFGTMGKPYNAGIAAQAGVEAALLAAAGFVARPDALEAGFGPTHHGAADLSALDGLGRDWRFLGISHKFHACCHGLHAMLEALAGQDGAGVEAVEIATNPRWLTVCNIAEPATGLEAKFSYRLTAAMALAGRSTGALDSFTDAACHDPELVALRDRVQVTGDANLAETEARVRLTGVRPRELHHDLTAPLSFEDRAAKLRAKARALLGDAAEARLWEVTQGTAEPAALAACLG
ncbi:MmgE/PrpD family protein [Frigidibacter sp. ROC022]|uniref:MmgE/PrpD family protein n=1 Tax=Frigidibacter sp. ROC022 TaxID=2971796 RepID=UPI00215B6A67|nr:MmgE/PrpD family protein [Frigidibacter sp. ROC022]MCR8723440.1 MmgE/PrpD family protein [Frigidibacter sp. ROC022]